jgi:hypothetical protein
MQHCGMTLKLRISKRGGGFLQTVAAVPMPDVPRETLARWIARDEAAMAALSS